MASTIAFEWTLEIHISWAQQHSNSKYGSDCKTETQANFFCTVCLSYSCSEAHRSDRARTASLQTLHYIYAAYVSFTRANACSRGRALALAGVAGYHEGSLVQ